MTLTLDMPTAVLKTACFSGPQNENECFGVRMLMLMLMLVVLEYSSVCCQKSMSCTAFMKACDWQALFIICKTLKSKSPFGCFIYSCSGISLSKPTSCMLRLILLLCCCKFAGTVTLNFPTQISIGFPLQSKLFMDHRCPNVLSPLKVPSVK